MAEVVDGTRIRRLTAADHEASYRLRVEAFGGPEPGTPPPAPPATPPSGRDDWGVFAGEELVAEATGLELASWWHGAAVPTCGIASVAVSAEARGAGTLQPLLAAALDAAAERDEPLSTLYPTANGIYRRLGYELVSSYDTVELPTAELGRIAPPRAVRVRRATDADVGEVNRLYDTWSAAQNGMLTRRGPCFATVDQTLPAHVTAVTLAVDADDRVVGWMSWNRGRGYDAAATIEVRDLLATSLDGYRALWTVLASHASVTGTVRLHTSGDDPARLAVPTASWTVVSRHPYMLRVSDPAGALTAARLGLPGLAPVTVRLAVRGDPFGRADGDYVLTVGDGSPGTCVRSDERADACVFTPQGIALAYAGAQSCANLRMTGHLTGPDTHDALLDALLGGRPRHIRNYF